MNTDKIREILDKLYFSAERSYGFVAHEKAVNEALAAITSELEKAAPRWVKMWHRGPMPDSPDQIFVVADMDGKLTLATWDRGFDGAWAFKASNGGWLNSYQSQEFFALPTPPAKKEDK